MINHQLRAKTKEAGHGKMIKNVGLDVHKNSISIRIADDGRDEEVRLYGKIDNDMNESVNLLGFSFKVEAC